MRLFNYCLTLILAATFPAGNVAATSSTKDSLLCPAELVVLQADSKRFRRQDTSQIEKTGLKRRMLTALATLPELCRRFLDVEHEIESDSVAFVQRIRNLQKAKSDAELLTLDKRIEPILNIAPFAINRFQVITKDRITKAGEIYQEYCASCHQYPSNNTANPAYSLYDMARQQGEHEFLARMLLGVKGTPDIGLSNPLALSEIGAMREYFLSGAGND